MTEHEMFNLEIGEHLLHKRYGIVKVFGVINLKANTPDFGVSVKPITDIGSDIMQKYTGHKSLLVSDPSHIDFITKESVSRFDP